MERSGIADLPLHGGSVPQWLAARMTRLGTAIVENVVHHYGAALLSRLADPFWFQALGSVMGMDWHSSGITISVLGALKRGLNPRANELGFYVCGGRGRHSRKTPDELLDYAERTGLNGDSLVWPESSMFRRLDDQVRELCAWALASTDPVELHEISTQLSAALHEDAKRMRMSAVNPPGIERRGESAAIETQAAKNSPVAPPARDLQLEHV